MRPLLHLLAYAALFFLLFACGPTPAAETDTVTTSETSTPLDVVEEPVMPKDQTEGTAEASIQTIDLTKMQEPKIIDMTPAATPPETTPKPAPQVIQATPAKPAPKTTRPVAPPKPAPVTDPAPSTTPAPAAAPDIKVANEVVEFEMDPPSSKPDHGAFDALLKKHVNGSGKVNYASLKKNEAKLDTYLDVLAKSPPENNWSGNEALTYWLNAYNAFTLKLILNNLPVERITDLHGGKPWDVKWIKIGDKTYSLNNIEHDIIRPRFKDPRIHFAVVCAATSCPPLANYAFTPGRVQSQLTKLAGNFINSEKFNQTTGDVKISKIFEWYAKDFGDVRTYLNKYLTTDIPEGAEIGYAEYDWRLNKQ